jgi:hypothetical protein
MIYSRFNTYDIYKLQLVWDNTSTCSDAGQSTPLFITEKGFSQFEKNWGNNVGF